MTGERLEALLWRERDGLLSAGERAELDRLLAESPAAVSHRRRVAELDEGLAELREVEVPLQLRERIRRALPTDVETAAGATATPSPGWLRGRISGWLPSGARFAYLGAGLLAGFALSLLLGGARTGDAPIELDALYGTVGTAEARWLDLELPEDAGRVRLRREGSRMVASLPRAVGVEVTISFAGPATATIVVELEGREPLVRTIDLAEVPGR